jgi:hypothetical protein
VACVALIPRGLRGHQSLNPTWDWGLDPTKDLGPVVACDHGNPYESGLALCPWTDCLEKRMSDLKG